MRAQGYFFAGGDSKRNGYIRGRVRWFRAMSIALDELEGNGNNRKTPFLAILAHPYGSAIKLPAIPPSIDGLEIVPHGFMIHEMVTGVIAAPPRILYSFASTA
jgi:hypothetical protein